MSVGHGGQILLSQPAFELARDLLPAELRLRDLGEHREAARATACCRYLFVCSLQDERDGLKYAAEGLALAQKLGASELAVETVAMQGMLAMGLGDAAEAERFANEALSLAQTSGSDTSMPLILLGEIARIEGKLEKARDYNLASLELFERHGRAKSASNRLNLGAIELELGNLDAAAGWLSETLEIVYPKQHYPHVASALVAIAVLALKRNQPTRAATLWGAAGKMRDDRRIPVQVGDRPFEAWVERQLQALPAAEQAAAQTGRSMNLEAVVEMAREICAGARGLTSAGAPAARGERPSGE